MLQYCEALASSKTAVSCSFIILVSFIITSQGLTTPAFGDIGIRLSDTCLSMLKLVADNASGARTECPTYEELLVLFPDNSEKNISGDFIIKDGIVQRGHTKFINHFKYYEFARTKEITWIDPPGDILEKIPLITITSHNFTYPIRVDSINSTSFEVGASRYISPNCDEAIITANNFIFLLGDTIRLMKNDCNRLFTYFDEIKIQRWEATKHDITTSYKYQLDQFIKKAKIECSVLCFNYSNNLK